MRTLPGDLADVVARYLVAAGQEEDPDRAYQYAVAARELAARVGIVRETCAIAAYQAGEWSDALAEFRAARRLTGRAAYLPLMADCERGLGRLDRALEIVTGPEARAADRATQLELRIVESGIRRDQGLPEAAVVALQVPELTSKRSRAGQARLSYAYADALLDAGREEEAREWFTRAAAADRSGETDAADRVEELDDVLFEDLDDADAEDADAAGADLKDADPADAGLKDADPADAGLKDADAAGAGLKDTDVEAADVEDAGLEDVAQDDAARDDLGPDDTERENDAPDGAAPDDDDPDAAHPRDAGRRDAGLPDDDLVDEDLGDA